MELKETMVISLLSISVCVRERETKGLNVFCFVFLLAEYTDDEALISNNTSVIFRRIPAARLKPTNKGFVK